MMNDPTPSAPHRPRARPQLRRGEFSGIGQLGTGYLGSEQKASQQFQDLHWGISGVPGTEPAAPWQGSKSGHDVVGLRYHHSRGFGHRLTSRAHRPVTIDLSSRHSPKVKKYSGSKYQLSFPLVCTQCRRRIRCQRQPASNSPSPTYDATFSYDSAALASPGVWPPPPRRYLDLHQQQRLPDAYARPKIRGQAVARLVPRLLHSLPDRV